MALDLSGEQLQIAQIYQITFSNSTVMYFTSYGGTLRELPEVGGNFYTYISIKRSKIKKYTDMQVDVVDVTFPVHAFLINGKTIVEAIEAGWFENAAIIISQVDPKSVGNSREVFRGNISKGVEFDRGLVKIAVTSLLDVLKTEVPRLIYQEQCNHKLFDARCSLTKADYEETDTAGGSSTNTRIYSSVFDFSAHASGYWVQGELQATSGDNNGVSRAIRIHADGYVDLYKAFDFDVDPGVDTFKAYPGCDKYSSTCDTRFGNHINFFGFTEIPRPETLY